MNAEFNAKELRLDNIIEQFEDHLEGQDTEYFKKFKEYEHEQKVKLFKEYSQLLFEDQQF